jgi:hypothetical protein
MKLKKIRPSEYSDLDIIWAIRDIPSHILCIKLKSVLYTFVALIGNSTNEWYYKSAEDLAAKIGISRRRLQPLLCCLEDLNFLHINRPKKYLKGLTNEYKLNYLAIVKASKIS